MVLDDNGDMNNSFQRAGQISCPVCGNMMTKVDERKENGDLFVWYECSRNDCDGQWLQRISSQSPDDSILKEYQG